MAATSLVKRDGTTALAALEQLEHSLSEAKELHEHVLNGRKGDALAKLCKAARLGTPMVNRAMEAKLRSERSAGAMLAKMALNGGDRKSQLHDARVKLDDLDVKCVQSHRWQRLASLPKSEFEHHLITQRAAEKELTTSYFLKLAARQPTNGKGAMHNGAGEKAASLDDLAADKFGTIYADPPWQYGNQRTRAATDNHYETMTVDELCAMSIAPLAAERAHLHLWTTNGFLPDAFRVIQAWGFDYKSCFVWCKPQMGIGNYWRVSHEFLLLGVKGGLTFADRGLMSWGEFRRAKHSAKPEEIRGFIERASPGPYLELFGRSTRDGWTVFGNQVDGDGQKRFCG